MIFIPKNKSKPIITKGVVLESFLLNPCHIPSKPQLKQSFEAIDDQRFRDFRIEAGLRLYAQLLTNAWRKRCKELNELNDTFKILKDASRQAAENLEWKNSCYFEQQYENEDLTCQLHMLHRDIANDEKSIKELISEIQKLELKKQLLLMKINEKSEKCIACNAEISDLKLKEMQFSEKNRFLENELDREAEKAKELENSHDKISGVLVEHKTAAVHKEKLLVDEIGKLDSEIQSTKIEGKLLKSEILDLTKITGALKKFQPKNSNISSRFEKCLLTQQVAALKKSLEKTFEHKVFKNTLMALAIVLNALKIISPVFPTHIVNGNVGTAEVGYIMYS